MRALMLLLLIWVAAMSAPTKAHASMIGRKGCFDENRFCLWLEKRDDSVEVMAQRNVKLPVVITVYSSLMRSHHESAFLNDDNVHELGKLRTSNGFWRTMRVRWSTGVLNAEHNDSYRYRPPLAPIEQYPIVQGYNGSYSHQGAGRFALDFKTPIGTPVIASRGGVVIDTKQDSDRGGADRKYDNDANFVAILHEDGTTGEYYHLKYNGVVVKRGQRVIEGQLIGYTGNTGFSSLPHLHFGVYSARTHGSDQSIPITFSSDVPGFNN